MMTIKQMAKTFGMTVDEFARSMGYARQAFYHKDIKNKVRFGVAMNVLRAKSQSLFEAEQKEAAIRFEARNAAIKELEKMMINGGEEEQHEEIQKGREDYIP